MRLPPINLASIASSWRRSRAAIAIWLGLVLGLGCGGSAWGFVVYRTPSGLPQRWNLTPPYAAAVPTNSLNPLTGAIRFQIAADGWSSTNTVAELNSVRAAFGQWQAVPGGGLRFEEGPLVLPGADINTADGTNVVFWAKSSLFVNGGRDYIGGLLGVTSTRLEGEVLAEADLVLNGLQYRWFTDPSRPDDAAHFVEGIVLHEIGHFLGLTHSPVGGATLFARGDTGVNQQAGLSADEFAAVRSLYPSPTNPPEMGHIQGHVTKLGAPVFGAVVLVESPAEGVRAGTVTDAAGHYELPALPPGSYLLRVSPLDPDAADYLVRGSDINLSFNTADTSFRALDPVALELAAQQEIHHDLEVVDGRVNFWAGFLRVPTAQSTSFAGVDGPIALHPGDSAQYVGIYSQNLPTSGATLSVTGDGLTIGPTLFNADPVPGTGLHAVSVRLDVATNATPGLRSLVLRRTADGATAWVNGFLVIAPNVSDWNFDGLDDAFQRRWFPVFTTPEAAPTADPDGDSMNNRAEYLAGTVPTNALSALKLQDLSVTASGVQLSWASVRFKRYNVTRTSDLVLGPWELVGATVRATNTTAQLIDPLPLTSPRYYRVEVAP